MISVGGRGWQRERRVELSVLLLAEHDAECCTVHAAQAFQRVKLDLPLVRDRLDKVTFGTLIDALVESSSKTCCQRALELWAEMRARDIIPDEASHCPSINHCLHPTTRNVRHHAHAHRLHASCRQ